jgi:REP element-mobilizing transposase RayT
MARRPRDDAPGAAHHVMVRGIDRLPIFLDDADREDFLRRLSRLISELGFLCFAWALMPNHVHLVIRSGQVRISQLMARLGTGYARRFNERHDRVGHLFQNRFRSRCVVDDADLVGLVLYVTRNPLEAGLVADVRALEHFPWCGLGALLGHGSPRPFEAISETLALFGADQQEARQDLRSRLDGPEPAVPPTPTSVETTPSAPVLVAPIGFDALMRGVCDRFRVTGDELRSRCRSPHLAAARSALARRAAAELGLAGAEIARRLGITRAAVSVLLARRPAGEPDDLTF